MAYYDKEHGAVLSVGRGPTEECTKSAPWNEYSSHAAARSESLGMGLMGRFLIFDPSVTGHVPGYIQHLTEYWCEKRIPGSLDVLVSPRFMDMHEEMVESVQARAGGSLAFHSYSDAEDAEIENSSSVIVKGFKAWRVVKNFTKQLRPDHCLLLYMDLFQPQLALGMSIPCRLSGIYFRPSFHYAAFAGHSDSVKEGYRSIRKKWLLKTALQNKSVDALFSLDPFAVHSIQEFSKGKKVVYLPDPVKVYGDLDTKAQALRKSIPIDGNRKVLLLFGEISSRKGIHQLLESLKLLDPAICEKICLLLVGPITSKEYSSISEKIHEVRQSSSVQIIEINKFVPDEEIQPFFSIADLILTPYQNHVGMSAILVRAAAARKPVLSSDYGLMGEMVRKLSLGDTVDTSRPIHIAKSLTEFLEESGGHRFDPHQAAKWAGGNSPEQFASAIFHLMESNGSHS